MLCCPNAKRYLGLFLVLAMVCGFVLSVSDRPVAQDDSEQTKAEKMLRHVVMFQFKESSSEKDVQSVVDAFRALPDKIPEIRDFEYGTNNSPEGLNQGLTHCFLLTFHSEKDREVYLPHPAHKEFGKVLRPHLEKVTVIDYWATK